MLKINGERAGSGGRPPASGTDPNRADAEASPTSAGGRPFCCPAATLLRGAPGGRYSRSHSAHRAGGTAMSRDLRKIVTTKARGAMLAGHGHGHGHQGPRPNLRQVLVPLPTPVTFRNCWNLHAFEACFVPRPSAADSQGQKTKTPSNTSLLRQLHGAYYRCGSAPQLRSDIAIPAADFAGVVTLRGDLRGTPSGTSIASMGRGELSICSGANATKRFSS